MQEGFVSHVQVNYQLHELITRRKEKFANLGRTVQPFVITVGKDIFDIDEAYAVVDSVKFKYDSFLEAIDGCFQIFHATNASYPEDSNDIWAFIEVGIYKMKPSKKLSQAVCHTLANLGLSIPDK